MRFVLLVSDKTNKLAKIMECKNAPKWSVVGGCYWESGVWSSLIDFWAAKLIAWKILINEEIKTYIFWGYWHLL